MNISNILSYRQYNDFFYIVYIIQYIYQGVYPTLLYSFIASAWSIILAVIIVIIRCSNNKISNNFINIYISMVRGTPFFLQLFFIYFVLKSPVFIAAVIALSLNSSAYIAEIIRGSVESIDRSQFEASQSLCIPYLNMMIDVILPQALKNVLPSLTNETTGLLKESSVIGMIGVSDLMKMTQNIAIEQYDFVTPICIVGVFYYVIICTITYISLIIEKKIINDKNN